MKGRLSARTFGTTSCGLPRNGYEMASGDGHRPRRRRGPSAAPSESWSGRAGQEEHTHVVGMRWCQVVVRDRRAQIGV